MDNRIVVPKINAISYRAHNHVRSAKVELVGSLRIKIVYPDGDIVDLGIVSERVVTLAAIDILVGVLQGGVATDLQKFKYHASGQGGTAENSTDVALDSEVENREVGTQTSIMPGNYQTAATHAYTATYAITEHGVFSNPTGPTLFDRSKFSAVPVDNITQLQFIYDLTCSGA